MHIENQTSDQDDIKVCLYNTDDGAQWIPVGGGVFTVRKGVNHEWNAPGAEGKSAYHIKVFHASLIDGFLCGLNPAPVGGSYVVRGGGGSYTIDTQ